MKLPLEDNSTNLVCKKIRKTITKDTRQKIWRHWLGNVKFAKCPCCEERTIYRDISRGWSFGHDIPFSKGGTNHIENIIPICAQCNMEMGNNYTDYEIQTNQPCLNSFRNSHF
jgi:hypothetical protein